MNIDINTGLPKAEIPVPVDDDDFFDEAPKAAFKKKDKNFFDFLTSDPSLVAPADPNAKPTGPPAVAR
jgi:hypothetical protein